MNNVADTPGIGIARNESPTADDATERMKKADVANYDGKQAGRNCYRLLAQANA